MLTPKTFLQGRYRIVEQLGQGGMGTVYEAVDERLDTPVALKETHFSDARLRRQFESEARLLARLRHPALTKVIDHFVEDGGQFLVMEFIPGRDLWELLQDRSSPFTPAEVLHWADQLLDALAYLHSQVPPVVHRDIKPQNLKLTGGNQIILLDFGLAKGYRDGATTHVPTRSVLGATLAYAPLEQILQVDQNMRDALALQHPGEVEQVVQNGTGPRSDLYSLGATLIHLLTRKVPIPPTVRAMSVWTGRPDPLHALINGQLPSPLVEILKRATALGGDERHGSAEEMRASLREVIDGVVAAPTGQAPTLIDLPPQPPPMPRDIVTESLPATASLPRARPEAARLAPPPPRKRLWRLVVAGFALILLVAAGGIIAINISSRVQNSNTVAPPVNTPTKSVVSDTNRAPDSTGDESSPVREGVIRFPTLPKRLANTSLKDVSGKPFRLSDYRGSIVVLNFWATWCGPCRDEVPDMIALSKEYAPRGVNVIGLTMERADTDAATVREFVRQFQINYTVGYVDAEFGSMLEGDEQEGIIIPQTFIITRDGRIVKRYLGFHQKYSPGRVRESIDQVLF